jgi:hypothetical protein
VKRFVAICVVLALFIGVERGSAQGFTNLNFESATITPDPSSPYYPNAVYASSALPGWTATGFIGPNEILYNSASTGATSVSILGVNGFPKALDGQFSIYLYGGVTAASASISQTAVVPASSESILFEAQGGMGTLLVSLGGQNVSFQALSTAPNYTLYGGNISPAFSGQSEQLTFSALEGINNAWELDDIQFLTSPVPEPGTVALVGVGAVMVGLRRGRKRIFRS